MHKQVHFSQKWSLLTGLLLNKSRCWISCLSSQLAFTFWVACHKFYCTDLASSQCRPPLTLYQPNTKCCWAAMYYSKNQPPVGDPHNLWRGGPGGVRHETEGWVMDATWTTKLEIVWIAHRWLVRSCLYPMICSQISFENMRYSSGEFLQLLVGDPHKLSPPCLQPKKH